MKYIIFTLIFTISLFLPVSWAISGPYSETEEYLVEYAKSFYEKGNKPEAIHEFKKSLIVNPTNREAISYLEKLGVDIAPYLKRAEEYEKAKGIYVEKKAEKPPILGKDQESPEVKKEPAKAVSKGIKSPEAKQVKEVKPKKTVSEPVKDKNKEKEEEVQDLLARLKDALGEIYSLKEESKLKDEVIKELSEKYIGVKDDSNGLYDELNKLKEELNSLKKVEGSPLIRVFDAEIKLNITPSIVDNKSIDLKIEPKSEVTSYFNNHPSLKTVDRSQTIKVSSGELVTIQGFMCNENDRHSYKVPIFSKLVLLGQLFQYDKINNKNKDASVTITPDISRR